MTTPTKQAKRDPLAWPLYRVLRGASLLSRFSLKYPHARSLLRRDLVRLRVSIAKLVDRIDKLDQADQ